MGRYPQNLNNQLIGIQNRMDSYLNNINALNPYVELAIIIFIIVAFYTALIVFCEKYLFPRFDESIDNVETKKKPNNRQ